MLPVIGAELRPKDPAAALAALHKLAARLQRAATGALTLIVRREGDRVFVADSGSAIDDLTGSGPKLVDDPPFKDAVKAAGGGTPIVYADVPQLLPFLQSFVQLLGAGVPQSLVDDLGHVGTVVAVGRRAGTVGELDVRIARR